MARALAKRSKEEREQLRDAALLMRYRTTTPGPGAARYLGFKAIAKVLKLSVNQVHHFCTYTPAPVCEEAR